MIRAEFHKIFSLKTWWLLVIFLFLVNGYVQIEKTQFRDYTPVNYRTFFSEIEGNTTQQTSELLQKKIDDISDGAFENYPLSLVYDMQDTIAELQNYPNYLSSISNNASNMATGSIWGGTDTFSMRNIKKTPIAYNRIKNTDLLPLQPDLGIEDATNGKITSLLGIFLVFLFVSVIFIRDREQEMMSLLYSTKYGRYNLYIIKYLVAAFCAISIAILLFLENLIIGGMLYGIGNLSRPMQTIHAFYSSNLPFSVGKYLFLYCGIQMLAYLFFVSVFSFICTISNNNITTYVASAVICGTFEACYRFIPINSPLSLLHYWNPVQLLHTNEIFATYLNVNLFGYPVSSKLSTVSLIVAAIVIFSFSGMYAFSHIRNLQYIIIGKKHRHAQYVFSRFIYIIHRYLVLNHGGLLILALTAICAFSFVNLVRSYCNDDIYYENFTTEYAGELSERTYNFIAEKQSHYKAVTEQINTLESQNNPNLYELSKLYAEFNDKNAFDQFVIRINSIQKNDNAQIFYDTGYKRYFGLDGGKENVLIALYIMLFLSLLIPSVPSIDRKNHAMYLICSSKCGKIGYRRNILSFAVLAGLFASILTTLPYAIRILQRYGIQGLSAPAQSIANFANIHIPVTVLGMMLFYLILRSITSIVSAILMAGISTKIRSPITAHLICLAVFALPPLLVLLGIDSFIWIGVTIGVVY